MAVDPNAQAAIIAEYQRDFNRAPDDNELRTDLENAAKYGLVNPNGPTGGVLGGISARGNNTPGNGQPGTPTYANSGRAAAGPSAAMRGRGIASTNPYAYTAPGMPMNLGQLLQLVTPQYMPIAFDPRRYIS